MHVGTIGMGCGGVQCHAGLGFEMRLGMQQGKVVWQ